MKSGTSMLSPTVISDEVLSSVLDSIESGFSGSPRVAASVVSSISTFGLTTSPTLASELVSFMLHLYSLAAAALISSRFMPLILMRLSSSMPDEPVTTALRSITASV